LAGVATVPGATIRARGHVTGGYQSASAWFVDAYVGAPAFSTQPASQTCIAGTTVTLSTAAGGTGPVGYQWLRDGVAFTDLDNFAGVLTSTLVVSNIMGGNAGGYSVVITNAQGSITSAVAVLTVRDPVIISPPGSQFRHAGDSVSFNVTAVGTTPLSYQWRKSGAGVVGAAAATLILANIQLADAGSYDVVVSNSFGAVTSAVAVLSVDGAPADAFNPGINYSVNALAVQADGKVLLAGDFTSLGGQSRSNIGRVFSDGTPDSTFNPGVNSSLYSLAVETDAKIIVGGSFGRIGGQLRNYIGRLNTDGTLDSGFNPGANLAVQSLAVQADGKIVVGGSFTTLGGSPRNYIGRLNANGTLDSGFNPGASASVSSLALQADGKIVVGGSFTTLGGQPRNYLGRLNADGTLDNEFNPGAGWGVYSLAVQVDGKILVAGYFATIAGQGRTNIARLNADGSLDSTFNPAPGRNDEHAPSVSTLALQTDGKILVGGHFTTLGGQPRTNIARLNADGTVDSSFNPGATADSNPRVSALTIQPDGKILVGGYFTTLGGQNRTNLGRLNNTEPATQSLICDGSTIIWQRSGTGPEVCRTTFDWSVDGNTWNSLGAGSRIAGGWQLAGTCFPPNIIVRARGYISGGSSWFVESYVTTPNVAVNLACALDATTLSWITGGSASWFPQLAYSHDGLAAGRSGAIADHQQSWLETSVTGPVVLSFWWAVACGPSHGGLIFMIDGQTKATLTGNTPWTHWIDAIPAGLHSLVWIYAKDTTQNNFPDAAFLDQVNFVSAGAAPEITSQPSSQGVEWGKTAAFAVLANGSAPLTYQWQLGGTNLVAQTNSTLNLANTQFNQAGDYRVLVSNWYGAVTSSVAHLTVVDLSMFGSGLVAYFPFDDDMVDHAGARGTLPTGTPQLVPGTFGRALHLDGSSFLKVQDQQLLVGACEVTIAAWVQPQFTDCGRHQIFAAGDSRSSLDPINTQIETCDYVPSNFSYQDTINNRVIQALDSPLRTSVRFTNGLWYLIASVLKPEGAGSKWELHVNGRLALSVTSSTRVCISYDQPMYSYIGALAGEQFWQGNIDDLRLYNRALSSNELSAMFNYTNGVPISIRAQPTNLAVVQGSTATLSVSAASTAPLSYQWFFNTDTALANATNASLTLTNVQLSDSGGYSVRVTNFLGAVTSSVASLTVGLPPAITQQPQPTNILVGATFTLSVTASKPKGYQWFFDGNPLGDGGRVSGATSATLTITNAQVSDTGPYRVVVTNSYASVTSSLATVIVTGISAPPTLQVAGLQGPVCSFVLGGQLGGQYVIQTTTNVTDPMVWTPAYSFTLTNTTQPFRWTNQNEGGRFFRAQQN
jgi:uncharacterized delta-60 repeat protein